MRFSIEAIIDAELAFDLRYTIEPTAPTAYSIELREDSAGNRFTHVKVEYGTGPKKNKDKNARDGILKEMKKQAKNFGGRIRTHECYHEEGLPCVMEEEILESKGGEPNGGSRKRVTTLLERTGWD
ncbi:MAG: hypothetical protein LC650_02045 [Actinobacteria bacterium]|nr:hypothetical protein [Actinomycetota bacterium]